MKYSLISLRDLINSYDEQSVKDMMNKFSCRKNTDVEDFFCRKSIHYLNQNLARTFIYFNVDKLKEGVSVKSWT